MLEENNIAEVNPSYSDEVIEATRLVLQENIDLITRLGSEYFDKLEKELTEQLRTGAADLQGIYKSITKDRGKKIDRHAALIARDQSSKASGYLTRMRSLSVGIREGIWLHSHAGEEPRPGHKEFNGQRFNLVTGALIDNAGAGAKKPDVHYTWPGYEINCRCTYRPYLEGITDE